MVRIQIIWSTATKTMQQQLPDEVEPICVPSVDGANANTTNTVHVARVIQNNSPPQMYKAHCVVSSDKVPSSDRSAVKLRAIEPYS